MLVLASVVFLYYTTWTLLMVPPPCPCCPRASQLPTPRLQVPLIAIRRQRTPSTRLLPTSGVGYPDTGHPDTLGLGGRGQLLERGYD